LLRWRVTSGLQHLPPPYALQFPAGAGGGAEGGAVGAAWGRDGFTSIKTASAAAERMTKVRVSFMGADVTTVRKPKAEV
jgi:hypothetical protein